MVYREVLNEAYLKYAGSLRDEVWLDDEAIVQKQTILKESLDV